MAFQGDNRPDFDPAVADQLSTLTLQTGLNNFQLNAAAARNQLAASAAVLTLGVQQINAASLAKQTKIGPLAAAAAANLRASQDAHYNAGLNAASRVPQN